jgi:hypothetical protein
MLSSNPAERTRRKNQLGVKRHPRRRRAAGTSSGVFVVALARPALGEPSFQFVTRGTHGSAAGIHNGTRALALLVNRAAGRVNLLLNRGLGTLVPIADHVLEVVEAFLGGIPQAAYAIRQHRPGFLAAAGRHQQGDPGTEQESREEPAHAAGFLYDHYRTIIV